MSQVLVTDTWAALLADPAVCEEGGEHTNEGIDYARFLAMALIVEMERAELPDYALLFEYLQDIAVLDSATAPTKATLLQVKKKVRGSWSRARLCSAEIQRAVAAAGASPSSEGIDEPSQGQAAHASEKNPSRGLGARSPLGKLYLCVDKLSAVVAVDGVFVSNAGVDLKSTSGSAIAPYSRAHIQHLHVEDLEYIRKKLCTELKQATLRHLSHLAVEQSRVVPAAMRETVRGMLDEMLLEKYPGLPSVSGQLQEKLLAAFSACSGSKSSLTSLQEVVAKKGFTRSILTGLISQFAAMRTASSHLDDVIDDLKREGLPARKADKLRAEAGRIQIQMVREPQTREVLLWDHALDLARKYSEAEDYRSALSSISTELQAQAIARLHGPTSDREANAVALLALIHVDQEPTPAGSQPPEQYK
jgi:Cap4 dsDNA endonuclease